MKFKMAAISQLLSLICWQTDRVLFNFQEELLIFMELCPEGTLESLVELSGGLHEGLTRRFTAQLLMAVAELHKNGIVHRDIKPANIFLTDDRSCLKLGDFGSAVKIEAHTTMPGELKGYVGTQAYMAPEGKHLWRLY